MFNFIHLFLNTFFFRYAILSLFANLLMKPDFCMKMFKLSFTYAQLANETQWGCIICSRHWDVCRLLNTLWYCSVCIAICDSTPPLNILSACLNSSHVSKTWLSPLTWKSYYIHHTPTTSLQVLVMCLMKPLGNGWI